MPKFTPAASIPPRWPAKPNLRLYFTLGIEEGSTAKDKKKDDNMFFDIDDLRQGFLPLDFHRACARALGCQQVGTQTNLCFSDAAYIEWEEGKMVLRYLGQGLHPFPCIDVFLCDDATAGQRPANVLDRLNAILHSEFSDNNLSWRTMVFVPKEVCKSPSTLWVDISNLMSYSQTTSPVSEYLNCSVSEFKESFRNWITLSCEFFFVDVEKFCAIPDDDFPAMLPLQGMLEQHKSLMTKRTISLRDAFAGKYASNSIAGSHRWVGKKHPDPMGVQLGALRDFLRSTPKGKYNWLWIDFMCMFQENLTPSQKSKLFVMLSNINTVYFMSFVLSLVDASTLSRFRTAFEVWVSFQRGTSEGLVSITKDEEYNSKIICIHETDPEVANIIKRTWMGRSIEAAAKELQKPYMTVTCGADKHIQLNKVKWLDQVARLLCQTAPPPGEEDDCTSTSKALGPVDSIHKLFDRAALCKREGFGMVCTKWYRQCRQLKGNRDGGGLDCCA